MKYRTRASPARRAKWKIRHMLFSVATQTATRPSANLPISSATLLEKTADQVARFSAHPHFVTLHVVGFVAWFALNSGLLGAMMVFDTFPFALLGIILAVEAILLTGFLLISQIRQNRHAELRAELDYEVNVRSFRKLKQLEVTLAALAHRMDSLEPGHKVEER